jgi:dienelactone hydrolase
MQTVKEQALLLGPRRSLVAVVSNGAKSQAAAAAPTVVILNSGIVHRVGPNRMSVTLARALAAIGYTVVRFDLSGIGDSEPRPDTLPPMEAGLADIREALDSLEASRGTRRVILAGLCSGADFSAIYAGSDPRVVGAVLIDPSIPHTFLHWVHYYKNRLTRVESWLNIVRGQNPFWLRIKRRLHRPPPAETPEARELTVDDPEVRAFLEKTYLNVVARRVRLLAVLTGVLQSYREELIDAFPAANFGDLLRLEYFKDADHLFMDPAARARLIDVIVSWVLRTDFGAEARSVAP